MSSTILDKPQRSRRRQLAGVCVGLLLLLLVGWTVRGAWSAPSEEHLRLQCREALEAARWMQLAGLAKELTERHPSAGDGWVWRAQAARRAGNLQEAAEFLTRVPVDDPMARTAESALFDVYFGPFNQPEAAARLARAILEHDPKSVLAWQRLIFFEALSLQREAMIVDARRAIELECESPEVYIYLFFADAPRFTNGVELNRRWLEGDPTSEKFIVAHAIHLATTLEGGAPRDDIEAVRAIRQMADRKEAFLKDLLRRFPDNLEVLAWHLTHAIDRGDVDAVESLLAELPSSADNDNRFWRWAGWAHAQRGRREKAEAAYARALELHPLDWETRHFLAELNRRRQNYAEVDRLQQLVERAHDLRRRLEKIPNVRSAEPGLLNDLADYGAGCGDHQFAEGLRRQMALITTPPTPGAHAP